MRDQLALMQQAGLEEIEFLGQTGVSTSKRTHGALFRARKPARQSNK